MRNTAPHQNPLLFKVLGRAPWKLRVKLKLEAESEIRVKNKSIQTAPNCTKYNYAAN